MNKIVGLSVLAMTLALVGCGTTVNQLLGKNLSEVPYKKEAVTLDTTLADRYHVVGYAVMSTQTSSINGFGAIGALKQACMIDLFANDQGLINNYRIRARKPGDCDGLGKKRENKALKAYFKKDAGDVKAKWGEPAETYSLPVEEGVKCSETSLLHDCPKYIFNVTQQQVLVYKEGQCTVEFIVDDRNIVVDYLWDGDCSKLSKK